MTFCAVSVLEFENKLWVLHKWYKKYQLYLSWNDCRINGMAVEVAKSNCYVIRLGVFLPSLSK